MAETKVILTKTVANLGHSGDVITVKAGYARNYLIPQGLAFAWNKGAASQIEAMRRARLAKAVATREEAVAAKAAIEGTVVEIAAKVSESGKLFGGISADKIAAALAPKAAVEARAISVAAIKTTGEFPATVALHPEISASFTVKVVAEQLNVFQLPTRVLRVLQDLRCICVGKQSIWIDLKHWLCVSCGEFYLL